MRNAGTATRAAFAAAGSALLAACASGPVMQSWTAPAPGASWEVEQRNTGSYGKDVRYTVTRGDTTWKGAPALAMANSIGGTLVSEQGGNWLALLARDGKPVVSFDPPLGFRYPLQVGKSWSNRQRMTLHASGKTVEYDFRCKVEAFEKVTVPAGTFDAYRVHCNTSIGNDDVMWSSPGVGAFVKTRMQRDASNPFGPGTQESVLLRAPGR